jgi:hypothetical protein
LGQEKLIGGGNSSDGLGIAHWGGQNRSLWAGIAHLSLE